MPIKITYFIGCPTQAERVHNSCRSHRRLHFYPADDDTGITQTMKTNLSFANPAEVETECLAVVVLDHGSKDKTEVSVQAGNGAIKDVTAEVLASGEVTGKPFETTLLHHPAKLKAKRLLLLGGGKAKNFTGSELRKVAGAAVRYLKPRGIRSFTFLAPETIEGSEAVKAIVEGAFVGNFDPDTYKSDRKDQKIDSVTVVAHGAQSRLQKTMDEARIIGESQNFTRDLVNEPSNRMTPTILAERARKMAQEVGLKAEVYGADKLKELKMGAFWGVAQGSDEPPALIVLRYEPADAPATPVLGLAGKGVTFDTGGISIKSADGMEKMKYDMAGAAAMIGARRGLAQVKPNHEGVGGVFSAAKSGAMRASAQLKPNVKVIGVVCSAENMPDGKAFKPGDVVTAMSGKTIEIVNTDAEGRLVLADGLHYAKTLGCTHLINAATLTGACVVALGMLNAGLFSNDEETWGRFQEGTKISGEKFWRLPCTDDHKDQIKSQIADIMNTGKTRWGGAISAAMFLKEFVGDTPWVHLDIAGCAWNDEVKPWLANGPSGIAVRSIVEWVRSYSA